MRVRLDYGRNLKFCRSVNEEVVWATHVPRRRSRNQESEVAHERFSGDNYGACRRVAGLQVIVFLGFGHGARMWC